MMEAMARVLVVDDEPHIGELVGVALRYNGFEVTSVLSGRAALDEVRRARPDLVVLDVMLPDLDGFEVAKRIRETDGGADGCRSSSSPHVMPRPTRSPASVSAATTT